MDISREASFGYYLTRIQAGNVCFESLGSDFSLPKGKLPLRDSVGFSPTSPTDLLFVHNEHTYFNTQILKYKQRYYPYNIFSYLCNKARYYVLGSQA